LHSSVQVRVEPSTRRSTAPAAKAGAGVKRGKAFGEMDSQPPVEGTPDERIGDTTA
jgi:hypothetical protein